MARVTVEDCLEKVPNRFALVILASDRARQLARGGRALLECDNKPAVTALREIADEMVSPEDLNEDLIHSLQKYVEVDEPEPALTSIEAADAPDNDGEITFDQMSEEELLRGLESIDPPERRDD